MFLVLLYIVCLRKGLVLSVLVLGCRGGTFLLFSTEGAVLESLK